MTQVSVRDLLKDRDERERNSVSVFPRARRGANLSSSSCSTAGEALGAGRTDRYPKCRLAGLRAGMRCEPTITTTQCHPEEGNFVSKVSATRRRGRREARRGPHSCNSTMTPRVIPVVSSSRRGVADHVPAAKLFRATFDVDRHNQAQSIRTKHKVSRGRTCRAFETRWSSDLFQNIKEILSLY